MSIPDETQILAHEDQPGGNWLTNSAGYQTLLVLLLSLNFGIVFFDRQALNVLMPFVQPDLQLSGTQIGLLAGVFLGAFAGQLGVSAKTDDEHPVEEVLPHQILRAVDGLAADVAAHAPDFDADPFGLVLDPSFKRGVEAHAGLRQPRLLLALGVTGRLEDFEDDR